MSKACGPEDDCEAAVTLGGTLVEAGVHSVEEGAPGVKLGLE